jgi:hypothetical protein
LLYIVIKLINELSVVFKNNKALVPTEFFDDREKAIAWLRIMQKSMH